MGELLSAYLLHTLDLALVLLVNAFADGSDTDINAES